MGAGIRRRPCGALVLGLCRPQQEQIHLAHSSQQEQHTKRTEATYIL